MLLLLENDMIIWVKLRICSVKYARVFLCKLIYQLCHGKTVGNHGRTILADPGDTLRTCTKPFFPSRLVLT